MGTSYTIKFMPKEDTPDLTEVSNQVVTELEKVNAQMSTYRADSELSRFNSIQSTDWFTVSLETAQVVELALQYHQLTEGSFDVTVGPLVDLWGFGPAPEPKQTPTRQQIAEIMQLVGSDKLQVRLDPPALRKTVAGLRVDLSAIAKGHGVDRVAEVLDKLGITDHFVEIGGEIRTRGYRHDGQPWQVGIERPNRNQREVYQVIGLSNQSMATSGDYRNVIQLDGQEFSHFMDPGTGWPVPFEIASVSVIADNCAAADAIATGLMAAGFQKATKLIEKHNWAALLLVRRSEQFESIISPRFAELVPEDDLQEDSSTTAQGAK
jgi:thiamine biosynthesis lipoprotein